MSTSPREALAHVSGIDEFDEADVLKKIHLAEDDILLLSGSLVDGSGTPSSDFDFSVLSQRMDSRFDRATFPRGEHMRFYTSDDRVKASFDYLPSSLLGIDVEYRTIDEVLTMLDAHDRLYRYMTCRARKVSSFADSRIDFRFLSRLTYAVPLTNEAAFVDIRAKVRPAEIAYTAFRTSVGSYPDFRDLAGMYVQGDHDSAVLSARKLAVDTMRGLTHACGNTNRNSKYLLRFLSHLPSSLGDLGQFFSRMLVNDVGISGATSEAVLSWLDLIDSTFEAIRLVRTGVEAFPTASEFLATLTSELHETMEWNAEISNEYCFRAREALDDLPTLRELLAAMARRDTVPHWLPLREWATGREAPTGENNKLDG